MIRQEASLGAAQTARCPFWVWPGLAVLLACAPLWSAQGFALGLMSQMCAMSILALSYNLLLGHTGMLSFGHAVYAGLGGFAAVHILNRIEAGLVVPVAMVPLAAGVAGALAGAVLGAFTTRRGGTPFAMISLGIGELVYAVATMFPAAFGGESGVVGNRAAGRPLLGFSFGPDIEMYYLSACWTLACLVAMYALTHTALIKLANAVRDNPQRAAFIGHNPHTVRFLMLVIAAFFAGIAGGLAAMNVEIATTESLGTLRSGSILLAAVIGGTGFFFGPALGAIAVVLFTLALSRYTNAWQLYLGLAFGAVVMFAPGGLAGWLHAGGRALRERRLGAAARLRAGATLAWLVSAAGAVLLIESAYVLRHGQADGMRVSWLGLDLDVSTPLPWWLAGGVILAGAVLFVHDWRQARSGLAASRGLP